MITFPTAKINIGLNVVERREDGFHNIETVFYPINLHDVLEITKSSSAGFQSTGIKIPGNENSNLCLKAYDLIKKDYKLPNVTIHLHKAIPIGAGLGGGSADGAFTIKMLNDQFDLNISNQKMQDYATTLGSDCAFFIDNKPAYAWGKGDQLRQIELDLSDYSIMVVYPHINISTVEAYKAIKLSSQKHALIDLIKLPIEDWGNQICNDFEKGICSQYPEIRDVKIKLYDMGAIYSSMSGSGSVVYGIFKKTHDLAFGEGNADNGRWELLCT